MNKKEFKNYLFESIMRELEVKKRTKETAKLLNNVVKLEDKFFIGLSDKKKKEYCNITLNTALFEGSETCDEIKFAINFIVELYDNFR